MGVGFGLTGSVTKVSFGLTPCQIIGTLDVGTYDDPQKEVSDEAVLAIR